MTSTTAAARPPAGPVLLTGFEPFDGEAVNPSWQVAQALDGRVIAGVPVIARELPCVFATALPALQRALDEVQPRLVVALGLAGSRSAVSVERVAINLIDARIADNAGARPVDEPVIAGAAPAHFTSLPVKAIVAQLQSEGLAAELSFSAGSFVCNQVFFGLMQALATRPGVRGGFIHLPPLPEQAARHASSRPMALAQQVQAIRGAIEVALARADDLAVSGGRVD